MYIEAIEPAMKVIGTITGTVQVSSDEEYIAAVRQCEAKLKTWKPTTGQDQLCMPYN